MSLKVRREHLIQIWSKSSVEHMFWCEVERVALHVYGIDCADESARVGLNVLHPDVWQAAMHSLRAVVYADVAKPANLHSSPRIPASTSALSASNAAISSMISCGVCWRKSKEFLIKIDLL